MPDDLALTVDRHRDAILAAPLNLRLNHIGGGLPRVLELFRDPRVRCSYTL